MASYFITFLQNNRKRNHTAHVIIITGQIAVLFTSLLYSITGMRTMLKEVTCTGLSYFLNLQNLYMRALDSSWELRWP